MQASGLTFTNLTEPNLLPANAARRLGHAGTEGTKIKPRLRSHALLWRGDSSSVKVLSNGSASPYPYTSTKAVSSLGAAKTPQPVIAMKDDKFVVGVLFYVDAKTNHD